jgi:peptidoglycan/xylan/chitin deacetylase (PgdA/CDA1 family)
MSHAHRTPPRAATTSNARRIAVVFRFDDYDRANAQAGTELLAFFQKHHVPCTYGITPFETATGESSLDPEKCLPMDKETAGKLDAAVRSGLVEVALHGFTHSANAAVPASTRSGGSSEFSGLDYLTQLRMLSAGKGTLESLYRVRITTFVPPWNSYDENTLLALDNLGFEVISASSDRHSITTIGHSQKLRFLPCTCDLGDLREAVEAARRSSDHDALIVVLLHPYDFVAFDPARGKFTYEYSGDLLSWLASQPDVATRTLAEAAKLARDLGPARLEAVRTLRITQSSGPKFFRPSRQWLFYPSTHLARNATNAGRARHAVCYACFYLLLTAVLALLVGFAARLGFSRVNTGTLPRIAEYATTTLLGFYVIYTAAALSRHAVRHRHMATLAGLLGACLGTWVAAHAPGSRL